MTKEEFLDYQSGPMSMSMGTCDLDKNPLFTRVWGVHFADASRETLNVILPKVVADGALANLKINPKVSVNTADMFNFLTNQYKGQVLEIRDATVQEIAIAEMSKEKATEVLSQFYGELGTNWSRYITAPAYTVSIKIEEVYNQTPGKMAGTRIL